MAEERREQRRKNALVGFVFLALTAVSLCLTSSDPFAVSPVEVLSCYGIFLQQSWLQVFDPSQVSAGADILSRHPMYQWTLTNFGLTGIYAINGALLALAGMLYQNVFRNPIAAPNMLGVSSGVQAGVALLLLLFGTTGAGMLGMRYLVCYAMVAVTLAALFGFSRLMGGKRSAFNVVNLLLAGTIINQFLAIVVTYLTWCVFDEELYDTFTSLTTIVFPENSLLNWSVLLLCLVLFILPTALARFRMNVLSFSPQEARMLGVSPRRLQMAALLVGTVIMVAAQLQVGMVAMVSLVIPHLSRGIFGAEFRKSYLGTLLLGAAALVACHIVGQLIPLAGGVPVTAVVDLVLLPVFVWIIVTQQEKWD